MRVSSGAIYFSAVLVATVSSAVDIKKSRFSQVVNDVKVHELSSKKTKQASVDEIFNLPDLIRTGPGSRAELVAEDKTITRIGANSIFSFDPANRTISLEKGSLLFQSPKGKGGGTIRTTSAAASVLGTTMIVAATDDGGFKVLLLEGSGRVALPNGKSKTLKPGQMVFVLPNEDGFSPLVNFRLGEQVEGSLLVNGFENELPSMDLINLEITRQNKLIANGKAVDTGLLVGDNATPGGVQVFDPNVLQDIFREEVVLHNPGGPTDPPVNPGPTDPGPGPIDPPPGPVDPPPVDPPPIIYDLIIGSQILDDEDLQVQPDFGYFMQGDNVLVDAETVDMSVATGYTSFSIDGNNFIEFADNPSHSTAFLGGAFNGSTQFLAAAAGNVYDLYFNAGDFIFPNEFLLSFDGYRLSLRDTDDMTLSSTSPSGLRLRSLASEGSLELQAVENMRLSGNVRLAADGISLRAGNDLAMDGTFLNSRYYTEAEAGNRLAMRNIGFGPNFSSMNLSARTVVLENILFPSGSVIYMQSELGVLAPKPNTGYAVQPGMVNFVNNVNYGNTSTPAQNVVGQNIFIGTLGGEALR